MVSTSIFIFSIGLVNFDSVFCGNRGTRIADVPANEEGDDHPIQQENPAQQNGPGIGTWLLTSLFNDRLLPLAVGGMGTGVALNIATRFTDNDRATTGFGPQLGLVVALSANFVWSLSEQIRNNRGNDETLAQSIIGQLRQQNFPLPGNAQQVVLDFLSQIRQRVARAHVNNNNNVNQGDIEMGHAGHQ